MAQLQSLTSVSLPGVEARRTLHRGLTYTRPWYSTVRSRPKHFLLVRGVEDPVSCGDDR